MNRPVTAAETADAIVRGSAHLERLHGRYDPFAASERARLLDALPALRDAEHRLSGLGPTAKVWV